ncbi:MAG: PAS domain S-box protein [Bacteroidota bacterium]
MIARRLTEMYKDSGPLDTKVIQEKLLLYRAFYISVAVFLVTAGHLINLIDTRFTPVLWDRYIFAGILIGTLGMSFWPRISFESLRKITFLQVVLTILHGFWLVYQSEGSPYYLLMTLSACIFCSLFADSAKQLKYLILSGWIGMIIFVIILSTSNNIYYHLFTVFFFVGISSFTYFIGQARIKGQRQIIQQRDEITWQNGLLKSVIESSDSLVFALDLELKFISYNSQCAHLLKQFASDKYEFREGDSVRPLFQIAHDTTFWEEKFAKTLEGHEFDFKYELKSDRSSIWYHFFLSPICHLDSIVGLICSGKDVTEDVLQKLASQKMSDALRQSEKRNNLLLSGTHDGYWDYDLETEETYFSPRLLEMLDMSPFLSYPTLQELQSFVHPEDLKPLSSAIMTHLAGESPKINVEFRIQQAGGQYIWVLGKGRLTKEQNHSIRLSGSLSDITERKLAEDLLASVLDSSPNGVMALKAVKNEEGHIDDFEIQLVNRSIEQQSQMSADELVGKRLREIFPGKHEEGIVNLYREVMKTQKSMKMEIYYEHELVNGDWYTVIAVPTEDGVTATFTKINQQKETERQLRLLSLVASKTDNGVVITDPHGKIQWTNEGFERITGYALEEIRGKKPGDVLQGPDTDPETVTRIRQKLDGGGSFTEKILNYRKAGEAYWVSLQVSPVYDQQQTLTHFVAIETDVTQQVERERVLKEAKISAENAAKAKSEFLATMSHEIRTPMNAVIGMTGLLLDSRLSDEQRDFVEVIRASGDQLLTIINDILNFSKIDSGQLELESKFFGLTDIIEDVMDLFASKALEKNINLLYYMHPDVPGVIESDPTRLSQVLVNLIGNALKFTEQGEVMLLVLPGAPSGERAMDIQFVVKDSGIGIPEGKLDRLFKLFSQVDASTTRKYGGTGLGLAISKRLVELMGGNIWVKSKEGLGSSFYFEIHAKYQIQQSLDLRKLLPKVKGQHILVLEPHFRTLSVLHQQMLTWGMRPVSGRTVGMGVQHLEVDPKISVILLNHDLVDSEGISASRWIKSKFPDRDFQFILMTNFGQKMPPEASSLFSAVINKPIHHIQLLKYIERALNLHHEPSLTQRLVPVYAQAETEKSHNWPKLSILLAEDNKINQKVASRMLSRIGYEIDIVPNGKEALAAIQATPYDLIFMDMQMPEMDGLEATRQIRKRENIEQPIIIAMTANALVEDRARCIKAGMDDYIAKPVKPEYLKKMLRKWFVMDKRKQTNMA